LLFQVGPHEIYVVGREDDGGSLDDGTASDAASWETVDDNEMDVPDDSANVFSTAKLLFFCLVQSFLFEAPFSFLLFLY
jgi:hypothetical protein